MYTDISKLLDERRDIQEKLERGSDSARDTFRYKLPYLNSIEKVNCAYCDYANGVMACAREIISRTGQRWCSMRHARHVPDAHKWYPQFFPYGDARFWHAKLQDMHQELVDEPVAGVQELLDK